jgi:hypothetical protein
MVADLWEAQGEAQKDHASIQAQKEFTPEEIGEINCPRTCSDK